MRRGWRGICCLVALGALGIETAHAADTRKTDTAPSLEYRPPKPILPEPKGPTPAPPVTVFRESFGGFGIGRGSFDKPADVAFGADGRTYVLDAGNSRIQLFDKSKNFLQEWGDYGKDENRCQFRNPTAIAVVRDVKGVVQEVPCPQRRNAGAVCEILLVADTGNDRFYWFQVPLDEKDLTNLPCGHADSNFITSASDNGKVQFDIKPGAKYTYGVFGERGIQDGKFDRPLDALVVSSEVRPIPRPREIFISLLILDAGNERVQVCELPKDRPPYYECQDLLSKVTGTRGELKDLASVAVSREGAFDYLYLLGRGCSIQKFKFNFTNLFTMNTTSLSTSGFNLEWSTPVLDESWPAVAPESGLCVPERIRYDSRKEYVYVLDSGNSILSIFHRSGNFISALRAADRPFDEPHGFTFIPATGEFALADTGNNIVQKFTQR